MLEKLINPWYLTFYWICIIKALKAESNAFSIELFSSLSNDLPMIFLFINYLVYFIIRDLKLPCT